MSKPVTLEELIDRLREENERLRASTPHCPSCASGFEATVRMDKDDCGRVMAVWHCNLCEFEWFHESTVVAPRIAPDRWGRISWAKTGLNRGEGCSDADSSVLDTPGDDADDTALGVEDAATASAPDGQAVDD